MFCKESEAYRGGGDRTTSEVETPQVIDSSNGQNRLNGHIRRSEEHAGYTGGAMTCLSLLAVGT